MTGDTTEHCPLALRTRLTSPVSLPLPQALCIYDCTRAGQLSTVRCTILVWPQTTHHSLQDNRPNRLFRVDVGYIQASPYMGSPLRVQHTQMLFTPQFTHCYAPVCLVATKAELLKKQLQWSVVSCCVHSRCCEHQNKVPQHCGVLDKTRGGDSGFIHTYVHTF